MAFKSFSQYQEDKNGEFFVLPNNGDYADVVFLYRSAEEVLVADVHYLSTATYNGYVHCCGRNNGCPACNYPTQSGRGIQVQNKLFIPLYNMTKGKVEYWDRSTFFESVLHDDVFKNYPNPSEIVFRITRNGAPNDRNTRYKIDPIGRNVSFPYEKIMATFNLSFPDSYSVICKEMSVAEMAAALNSSGAAASSLNEYSYTPVPRGQATAPTEYVAPQIEVPTPVYSAPPEVAPPAIEDIESSAELPAYEAGAPADPLPEYAAPTEYEDAAEAAAEGDDIDNVSF